MRTKQGTVVSTKMQKTVIVEVKTYKTHPKYKKKYFTSKKYFVHDELSQCKDGDTVMISEGRPLSKMKRWVIQDGNQPTA